MGIEPVRLGPQLWFVDYFNDIDEHTEDMEKHTDVALDFDAERKETSESAGSLMAYTSTSGASASFALRSASGPVSWTRRHTASMITYRSIMKCDVDIRKVLHCNVFVVCLYHLIRHR